MPNLSQIVRQLRTQRDEAQREVERLNAALMALGNVGSQSGVLRRVRSVKNRKPLSAAARKRIAAAQRARWAKWKAARRSK
jgi:ribosomal protein S12